jgi:S1-C subfamily serine protease
VIGVRPAALIAAVLCAGVLGAAVAVAVAERTGTLTSTVTIERAAERAAEPTTGAALPLAGNRFDPATLYARRSPGVVTVYASLGAGGQSQGSGFVVDRDGTILTNAHVITNVASSEDVRGADALYVEFRDGERVPATIVGWDLFNDIGAIRVDPRDHAVSPVPLGDSAGVRVGEPVAAIGSPFGNQNSLAVGVVSATGRSIESLTSGYAVADAIQIDAPINRGNSGGPLFDARGRVIGINAQIRSTSGTAEGVGFAIPINVARRALQQLIADGRVAYAYFGISTQDLTPGLARRFGIASPRGALVVSVEEGTPAAAAGIRGGDHNEAYNGLEVTLGGDVILKIGPHEIRSSEDVSRAVAEELRPGQTVRVALLRDGTERKSVDVTLSERPRRPGA